MNLNETINLNEWRIISATKPTSFVRLKLQRRTPISVPAKKIIRRLHDRSLRFSLTDKIA